MQNTHVTILSHTLLPTFLAIDRELLSAAVTLASLHHHCKQRGVQAEVIRSEEVTTSEGSICLELVVTIKARLAGEKAQGRLGAGSRIASQGYFAAEEVAVLGMWSVRSAFDAGKQGMTYKTHTSDG